MTTQPRSHSGSVCIIGAKVSGSSASPETEGLDHSRSSVNDETELTFADSQPSRSAELAPHPLCKPQGQFCGRWKIVTGQCRAGHSTSVGNGLTVQPSDRAEITDMDDQALQAQVGKVTLFCRVTPSQKNRIILALKRVARPWVM